MRLRYVKGAADLIASHPEKIINDRYQEPIDLSSYYRQEAPLHVEIGMGKGQFIYTLATNNPHINYLGIEKFDSAIVKALYKVLEDPRDNLMLLRADAEHIETLIADHSIDHIYLNFSDPWPKARHEKRRLTNPRFLAKYERLLTPGGVIECKTDNKDLFEYSVETMVKYGMILLETSEDYHHTHSNIITTEFEDKFVEQGQVIYYLKATFKEEQHG